MHESRDLHGLFSRRQDDAHFSVFLFLLSLTVQLLSNLGQAVGRRSVSGLSQADGTSPFTAFSFNTPCLEDEWHLAATFLISRVLDDEISCFQGTLRKRMEGVDAPIQQCVRKTRKRKSKVCLSSKSHRWNIPGVSAASKFMFLLYRPALTSTTPTLFCLPSSSVASWWLWFTSLLYSPSNQQRESSQPLISFWRNESREACSFRILLC